MPWESIYSVAPFLCIQLLLCVCCLNQSSNVVAVSDSADTIAEGQSLGLSRTITSSGKVCARWCIRAVTARELAGHAKQWVLFWALLEIICEVSSFCGTFGSCDNVTGNCRCLEGFRPSDSKTWEQGDFYGGCARKVTLQCTIPGMDNVERLAEEVQKGAASVAGGGSKTPADTGLADICSHWMHIGSWHARDGAGEGTFAGSGTRKPSELELAVSFHQGECT
ncbi:hypothetical protein SAY86_004132 [Trapa natans]|uniref:S-locus glycoprotein domain-containing protein n=1 Tax=Trapa natans TaxID=22666 RepID=A0AAN7MDX9_TRANT|nr:hypothetical protein SAY86_004132 [Trapa natans]